MRTALVVGASGFIGRHVAAEFSQAGWRVAGVDRRRPCPEARACLSALLEDELADAERLTEFVCQQQPGAVIYAAGPASVGRSFADPRGDLLGALAPFAAVLEAVRREAAAARIVLCSSAAVYGAPEQLPITEAVPARPVSPYGWHKLMQETLLAEYVELYRLKGNAARIFSTFGPGLDQLAVYDLARRALRGEFTCEGEGGETRDYLYVADVAAALRAIAENAPGDGGAINVGSGAETEIADLARRIAAHFGKSHARFRHSGAPAQGKPARWRAETGRLAALGFQPRVSFAEGLSQTLEWIASHV